MTLELELAVERFNKIERRNIDAFGWGDSTSALSISRQYVPELTEAIKKLLEEERSNNPTRDAILNILRALDEPEVLALSTLSVSLHAVATSQPLTSMIVDLGAQVAAEIWARELESHQVQDLQWGEECVNGERLAQGIERVVRRNYGDLKRRQEAARAIARKAGFRGSEWTNEQCVAAGNWLFAALMRALPDVFTVDYLIENETQTGYLTISPDAEQLAANACEQVVRRNPVFLPCVEPPIPWTEFNKGGPIDPRSQRLCSLIRTKHHETKALVRRSIKDGKMQPALDALNAIQATPWRINKRTLEVLQECKRREIAVEGVPPKDDYVVPEAPGDDATR
jgi:DNA-directed RNA polymerase